MRSLTVLLASALLLTFVGVSQAEHLTRVQKRRLGTTLANGHTSNDDLGTAIVGFSLTNTDYALISTSSQRVYFTKTATGDVSVSPGPTPPAESNLFPNGTQQALTFTVDSSSAGAKAGSVVVDNTSGATFNAVAGQGPNDPNERFNFTATVLDPSNASFDGGSDSNTLTIDFGEVDKDSTADIGFDIHNLVSTLGYTAGLDLLSVVGSGDTDKLTTDITSFVNSLAAGDLQSFLASLDTSEQGDFSATYTFTFGDDQTVLGATGGQTLTLNLLGVVTPEPASMLIWSTLGIAGVYAGRRRLRKRSKK